MIRRLVRWLALGCAGVVAASVLAVALLRWVDPPTSAFMLRASLAHPDEAIRHRWADLEEISPFAAVAVIAAEDQLFPFHSGFDLDSIREAAERNTRSRRVRGASTISQQVAKNLFLWPGPSWLRKGLESWFTLWIEALWPKRRILEVYLNSAEFGRGVWGVEAASRRYFGKPAARLDRAEAALLAAVLPSPKRLRAAEPSAYLRQRQDWVLWQMGMLERAGLNGDASL